jgi:hypothetical protein
MNIFVIGVFAGATFFMLVFSFVMLIKLHTTSLLMQQSMKAQLNVLQLALVKINKIEKVTDHTMTAAETFVDALRESAEQMQMMNPSAIDKMNPDSFDDLRQSFEEGIKGMEDDSDDEDASDNPPEPWK